VTGIDARGVDAGGARIESETVLWAAGVAASELGGSLGAPRDRAGRVKVEEDLSVAGAPHVFVVGDLAAKEQDGALVPGLAGAAIQGGRHAARSIERLVRGQSTLPFRYVDRGTLATIGRAAAVAQIGSVKLRGFVAWLAWLFIHIVLLIGFRNRLVVLLAWAWEYWTYDRGPRLITGARAHLPSDPRRERSQEDRKIGRSEG
jgi:NADH:quinone reductase (non-electrogenic)